ncbi:MAG: PQQ-binding-like beta-propeller repeat protein, partial [Gemmataceae bacterium]
VSVTVAALSEGALRSMVVSKLKIGTMALLACFLVTGMAMLIPAAARVHPEPPAKPSGPATVAAGDNDKSLRVDRFGEPLPDGAMFRFGSVRMRHVPAILGSALSPDGKLLATTSGRSVVLWDLKAGKALHRFSCDHHSHFTNPSLTFSPDGRHLGYVQSPDFACVWDVKGGKQVAEFDGDNRHNMLCQFSSDGKTFLFGNEKRLIFWDLHANREVRSIAIKDAFLLTPDARFCVRFDKFRRLRFIDTVSGEETGRLDVVAKYSGFENGVAFAPDGKALAVVHQNKQVQVRGFPDGKLIFSVPLPASAKRPISGGDYWEYQLAFPDRRTLMLGTSSGVIHRWDLATGKEGPALTRHIGAVAGVHASPDGKTIVTTGADGVIRRWDRQTGRELSEPAGYMGRTHAVYSPDGRYVAIGDARGRLELWDARIGRSLRVLQQEGPAITKLAVASGGPLLAAARADNTVHFWTLPHGKEPRVLHCGAEHNLAHMWNMRFSPDGRRLLIADGAYHARLWEVATGKVCWRATFGSAVFSPEGRTLAMAFVGPYLNLLDASSGKVRARLRQDTNAPEGLGNAPAMAFSPDGKHLAQAVNGVYLCDAQTGTTIHHFQAADQPRGASKMELRLIRRIGEGGVHGLAFSPDGRWLGTSGWDGSVRLWEVATGRQVLRFDGHVGDVKQVAFGTDSRTILSCGADAQAYLWSLRPSRARGAKPSLDSLWTALADEPAKAYRAIWAMSETKEATAFLRDKLVSVKPVSNERLRQLIAELESDAFAVRERATKALAELGEVAVPAMRKVLADKPPLETRKRLEDLLQRVDKKVLAPDELRILRAIDALERQGTAEARQVLKKLAQGMPEARVTREAKASLERLNRRGVVGKR